MEGCWFWTLADECKSCKCNLDLWRISKILGEKDLMTRSNRRSASWLENHTVQCVVEIEGATQRTEDWLKGSGFMHSLSADGDSF